uniref:CUB_2 domain-containing protein n=1 Tax=Caenorhabditis japonica TaxID=281687 RepID=A0A8R1ENT0_CAEJA
MSSFVLFILLASKVVVADIPECTGGAIQFDPPENPDDSNKYTWYPNNFTGTQPPMFPNDYTCTYKINVPINWSAMVVMTLNLTTPPQDGAISVQVIDHNQRSEQVASADNEHYFFIANGGRIQLATRESNVIFGFAVKWTKLPRNFASFNDNVTISQSQPVVYWAFSTYPIQIRAETKVSLVITPPVEDELMQYLRSIIIYDGPDWNSTSLGTGLQLFAGKRQYVSSGSYMTVQQLAPAFPLGRTMLVFQDYENTKDIVEYQGATCARVENCGQFLMDGSIGMAAMTTVNERSDSGAECVNSMSGSGDLDVYIGGKTKSKSNLI